MKIAHSFVVVQLFVGHYTSSQLSAFSFRLSVADISLRSRAFVFLGSARRVENRAFSNPNLLSSSVIL